MSNIPFYTISNIRVGSHSVFLTRNPRPILRQKPWYDHTLTISTSDDFYRAPEEPQPLICFPCLT